MPAINSGFKQKPACVSHCNNRRAPFTKGNLSSTAKLPRTSSPVSTGALATIPRKRGSLFANSETQSVSAKAYEGSPPHLTKTKPFKVAITTFTPASLETSCAKPICSRHNTAKALATVASPRAMKRPQYYYVKYCLIISGDGCHAETPWNGTRSCGGEIKTIYRNSWPLWQRCWGVVSGGLPPRVMLRGSCCPASENRLHRWLNASGLMRRACNSLSVTALGKINSSGRPFGGKSSPAWDQLNVGWRMKRAGSSKETTLRASRINIADRWAGKPTAK